jgi:hypothetical protein
MTEEPDFVSPEPNAIDLLHQELWGYVPSLGGEAYERLTAVVLAVLGWSEVKQQSHEKREGAQALQRLDVVARHPSGEQRRLIVQCKHYGKTVGKEDVDTLIGVGKQVGDINLAIVTTKGFKSGARDAAVDENVAMVVLRPYDPTDQTINFVREVNVTISSLLPPQVTALKLDLGPVEGDVAGGPIETSTLDPLEHQDGSEAEPLAYFIEQGTAKQTGEFDQRVELPGSRWLRVSPTGRVQIKAVAWHERIDASLGVLQIEGKGEPKLVLQQLDENLEATSGRVVVDEDLFAWDLDDNNNVVPRGQLATPPPADKHVDEGH